MTEYPSFENNGFICPELKTLARDMSREVRQLKRTIKILELLGHLWVLREAGNVNIMVPMLDGKPLVPFRVSDADLDYLELHKKGPRVAPENPFNR